MPSILRQLETVRSGAVVTYGNANEDLGSRLIDTPIVEADAEASLGRGGGQGQAA